MADSSKKNKQAKKLAKKPEKNIKSMRKKYILEIKKEISNLCENNLKVIAKLVYDSNKDAITETSGGSYLNFEKIESEILIKKIYDLILDIIKQKNKNNAV
jgi:type III secretory pathway component EscV